MRGELPDRDLFPLVGDASFAEPPTAEEQTLQRLRVEYSLQHDRDVWVELDRFPYLGVSAVALARHIEEPRRITLFTHSFMLQNLSVADTRRRLIGALVGGGTDGGGSASAKLVPFGRVNPNAFSYVTFNDPLHIGEAPMLATGTHLIVIDDGALYQYRIADLDAEGGYAYAKGRSPDFMALQEFVPLAVLHRDLFLRQRPERYSKELVADWLRDVFEVNVELHRAGELYHLRNKVETPEFSHAPPVLTAYGRLVHDDAGEPFLEHNFSLLHYRKSLEEFAGAKAADLANDADSAILHGAYAIIATAACVESIANKLFFATHGHHDLRIDDRTATKRLLDEAEELANRSGRHFKRLKQTSDEHAALERVRELRNLLLHAVESSHAIDPTGRSMLFAELTVASCRRLMSACRKGLVHVLSQVPEVRDVVSLDGTVKWTGDLEVP